MSDSNVLFSRTIKENLDTFSQWRVTINEFRGVQYFGIREYFLSFDGTWEPTKNGISVPLELVFTAELHKALAEIISQSETDD